MATKKFWLRPTQISKTFPANKYRFDEVLIDEGDWVKTNPTPRVNIDKFKKAVFFWAYHRKKTVRFKRFYLPEGMEYAVVELLHNYRVRDYR